MSKYVVTMRWYVETDDDIEKSFKKLSKTKKDEKILNILRHNKNGKKSCDKCPSRHNEAHTVLEWKDFYDKKPIYISIKDIKK